MTRFNRVVIESGKKKVFASALDWPGLSRSGKSEDDALATVIRYGERYRQITGTAGVSGLDNALANLDVVERLPGAGVTDFGVPDRVAECEAEPMTESECERQIRLLRACWSFFDEVAARVSEELQKGPRGGGRDRTAIIEHTLRAERGYVRKLGVKTPEDALLTDEGLAAHREAVCSAIRELNPVGSGTSWPVRYVIRRAAWHVLDHAWEMEDKDLTGKDVEQ